MNFDVEMAMRLKDECRRTDVNFTEEHLRRLCEGAVLGKIRKVLDGEARIIEEDDTLIDCDNDPIVPSWYTGIHEHKKCGLFSWDPKKVGLHIIKTPEDKNVTLGEILLPEIADKQVLNGCVRDYLKERMYLIPKEWRGVTVLFPGTVLNSGAGKTGDSLCVPCFFRMYHDRRCWWASSDAHLSWKIEGDTYAIAIKLD